MDFSVGNALGLLAFLSLIPLVILYLIRPKPLNLKVPSLMFFFNREKATTAESFLRRFHNDLLFFLQLIVLFLLASSIVDPSLVMKRDVVSDNLVFVLDVSASSSVVEGDNSRLEIAKDKIRDFAASKNSLVLLKSSPVLALQNVNKRELLRYLDSVEGTGDVSDISSAIMFAGETLPEGKGRVVVLSDFISSKGIPVEVAKNVVESRGVPVDFISTRTGDRRNVGIINMAISGNDVNLYIKNFGGSDENVQLVAMGATKPLFVKANSVEPFVFKLGDGNAEVELLANDDFKLDNRVFISKPFVDKVRVLLITNGNPKFLKAALRSVPSVELSVAEPPIIPDKEFDVYVLADLNRNNVLPGTFDDLIKKVDAGKSVIVLPQSDLGQFSGVDSLLRFKPGGISDGGSVSVDQVTKFTKDVDFGDVGKVLSLDGFSDEYVSLASVNDVSVMGFVDNGAGKIFYYGIFDDSSDFKLSPDYPVFWSNLVGYLVGKVDLNEINLRTGSVIDVANRSIVLDKPGYFTLGKDKFAVNLLNEQESNINFVPEFKVLSANSLNLEPVIGDYEFRFESWLLIFALLLVIAEIIYIKYRGEV